jgi:uncharacterized membrane protein YciS (DUF1049 family)
MAILGLLLLIAVVGGTVGVAWANQDAINASSGVTLNVFGEQVSPTLGQLFLAAAVIGAVVMLALYMTVGGTRRRMNRTATRRREQYERERDLQAQLAEANAAAATRSADERAYTREDRADERAYAREDRREVASHR